MRTHPRYRRAATMVLVAVLLPALFALSALAINIAHMESASTDIQIAADAAVRAASREYVLTGDEQSSLAAARDLAARNPIGNFVLPVNSGDLEFGISDRASANTPYTFTPSGAGNAVRLTTRTLASPGEGIDPVFPFFGSAFQIGPTKSAVSTQGVIDIALVIDRSGSMAYSASEVAEYPPAPASAPPGWDFGDPVPQNARWLDLIASTQVFINELNDSPVQEFLSLTIYDHESYTPVQLSTDYDAVKTKLINISSSYEAGGTNIGGGMYQGRSALLNTTYSRSHASKVIVLMTDGVHNYGTHPMSAAYSVANSGITLFAITFSDEADQYLMQDVADRCGGQHYHAVTATQLQEAFRSIARSLPTMLTK
ncbi:vWA domain-containing protein [Stieleria marina]|uniref:von Willebrand factor type A domain protein n=1 Tax=Stieleria marina TaxID=1930275 RepID=A0A517NQ41_9BACT|nr:von Willebrand factor type A domain protein [Planctomycetes bacterium K23_9]